MQPLGVHASIAGGLHMAVIEAKRLGCTAVQLFGRNPRSWKTRAIGINDAAIFKKIRAESGIRAVSVHTSYLINLSSPDDKVFSLSAGLFRAEIDTAAAIGADFLVTHLGSHLGMGEAFALKRVISALKAASDKKDFGGLKILFENSAGSGNTFGRDLRDLGKVIDAAGSLGINTGLCLDTCHAFSAGYKLKDKNDATAFAKKIKNEAGKKSLCLIHLNDSKGACASNIDRHEHLGEGAIGLAGLRAFFADSFFSSAPVILETPKEDADSDRRNLAVARKLLRRPGKPQK